MNAPLTPPPAAADPVLLRAATADDVPALIGLITELAAYESLTHLLQVTPQRLQQHLFGPRPVAECVVAQAGPAVVGMALFFTNFSTFLGQPGLYLEDLYVQPAWRGAGVGASLLRHVAGLAVQRGCGRFEWSVLDWNQPAIDFYQRMGAVVMPDWRICRVTGPALARLAPPRG
ncbi:GNAT family N-acetyltransferase [Ideonella livida]|uniref:GNAT family N-acetyltransferase n=1 Tax=Ideonella livida TaxID=2707176 RepID=A0A7C9TLP4_9BURK|nr:GNAT family N-acetyltransferase [Ideonella livida]NDY92403.1 GNAT family N-acetyltransferase [Ideonella livida]